LFGDGVFSIRVRGAVQLSGVAERRSNVRPLVVVVVRRPRHVPRVQAVLGRPVEAHAVQAQKRVLRLKANRDHVVLAALALVAGSPELGLRRGYALELVVTVRVLVVP